MFDRVAITLYLAWVIPDLGKYLPLIRNLCQASPCVVKFNYGLPLDLWGRLLWSLFSCHDGISAPIDYFRQLIMIQTMCPFDFFLKAYAMHTSMRLFLLRADFLLLWKARGPHEQCIILMREIPALKFLYIVLEASIPLLLSFLDPLRLRIQKLTHIVSKWRHF